LLLHLFTLFRAPAAVLYPDNLFQEGEAKQGQHTLEGEGRRGFNIVTVRSVVRGLFDDSAIFFFCFFYFFTVSWTAEPTNLHANCSCSGAFAVEQIATFFRLAKFPPQLFGRHKNTSAATEGGISRRRRTTSRSSRHPVG